MSEGAPTGKPWVEPIGLGFTADEFESYVRGLTWGPWKPKFCVVHNTYDPTYAEWHDVTGASRMRGLETYYKSLGWHAGPHIFVADDLAWVFTPLTVPGVHSPSWNAESWGVETTGDWNLEQLPSALWDNLVATLSTLHRCAGLDPKAMRFHFQDPLTTHRGCPGVNLNHVALVEAVADRMQVNGTGEFTLKKEA